MNPIQELGAGGALGVALQYLRSNSKFPELAYIALALVGAFALTWMMGTELSAFFGAERAAAWTHYVITLAGSLSGTQGASSAANVAVKAGLNSGNVMVPVTNSK